MAEPLGWIRQGAWIDIDEVAVEAGLGQQMAQTQAQEGVRLDQEDCGHGRSLFLLRHGEPRDNPHMLTEMPTMLRLHFHTIRFVSRP